MLVPAAVAVLLVGGLGWYWSTSLVPSTYSVMDMGYADYGGALRTSTARVSASPP